MAFATRSKFFWSRFIATCVKYLGVANTQHLRYLCEKILPTEMSRQNILYHVRIAEDKGWVATFSSSLEMTDENLQLFQPEFVNVINEKISAQRFLVIGTEPFEPEFEDKIELASKEAKLNPISIIDRNIISLITEESIKRMNTIKDKASGNKSLFMILLRFGWFWLNINPQKSLEIIQIIKNNELKHLYNGNFQIDAELLEYVSLIEMETTPETDAETLQGLLQKCIKIAMTNKRKDIMNLMTMILLITGRVLVSLNELVIAEEFLNRGIKYLRLGTRKSILMRKLHVDGLFDLGFIYSQQGWFYKALSVYENIERIINEEFEEKEPVDNLNGRLALAKAELYVTMAWPAYIFAGDDYRTSLLKALRYARQASRIYLSINNKLKITEIYLLSAWICALLGRLNRAELYLTKGSKNLIAPVPPKLNAFYYNAQAEIYRKRGNFAMAIKNINQSFYYLKIMGYFIARLFSMTRLSMLHVELTEPEKQFSFISYGDVTTIFEKGTSDMISHVFMEFNKKILKRNAIVTFYCKENAIRNHPEIENFVQYISVGSISPSLLVESFTIIPRELLNNDEVNNRKVSCIIGPDIITDQLNEYSMDFFKEDLAKFDDIYQKFLSEN